MSKEDAFRLNIAALSWVKEKKAAIAKSPKLDLNPAPKEEGASGKADDSSVITRYGKLSVAGTWNEMQLMFNDQNLLPESAASLSLERHFSYANSEAVLVRIDSGGTACPSAYFFVAVSGPTDVQLSRQFGTCSDSAEVSQDANGVIVAMPDSDGKRVRYFYNNGTLTEDGKPLL